MKVAVAIPTFRRPDKLRHLLECLTAQENAPPFVIVLADNDVERCEGLAVAAALRESGCPLAIDSFTVAERGLCTVRNALFARALEAPGVTHVALIDDDEWPDPGWLAALVEQQKLTGADAVGGPVRAFFPAGSPSWASGCFLFRPESRPAGPTPIIWGTNNALIGRDAIARTSPPWFDMAFNRTGGEDLDLFTRWQQAGRTFAWAPDAWVTEWVPPDRATRGWALRRMWRIGGTDTAVRWRRGTAAARAWAIPHTVVFIGFSLIALPLAALPRSRRMDHLGRFVRALGRVAGLAGRTRQEYD